MLLQTNTAQSFFVSVENPQNDIILYAFAEKRTIGSGFFGMFVIGWPVWATENTIAKAELIASLKRITAQEKCVFLQMEPLTQTDFPHMSVGYYKNFIPKHTAVINLHQTSEEILAAMKPKGRYNIGVAKKAWVTVRAVPPTSENIDTFHHLLVETTDRNGFAAGNKNYLQAMGECLHANGWGWLYFAFLHDEVIAWGVFVFFGKAALYYYGASVSSQQKRRHMPAYLLQWMAILDAKQAGCEIYDFLGIAPPGDSRSSLSGVTDFKKKLTPQELHWPQTVLFVQRPWVYFFVRAYKKIFRSANG